MRKIKLGEVWKDELFLVPRVNETFRQVWYRLWRDFRMAEIGLVARKDSASSRASEAYDYARICARVALVCESQRGNISVI